ncbi:MAG: 16S rRNA (adenine(1518)-N(6)/adenine(1519)-N(6))-dimethyltransferase RsmA [Acholeplasmataceae bacterium]|nr:16S rRNA (adenine(1518)-N(6)/adenine(1519)-N(6))-dimethyltransferase RsmA [Acholeplasmataceae bacterium]
MTHRAKKRFGQNFLKDSNILKKIVQAANIKQKNVVEIGPGKGALTAFLAEEALTVIAYEIDTSLKRHLDPLQEEHPNLNIVYQDFMKADLTSIKPDSHIVANVPYYITTPIIFKFLETDTLQSATMMIQKEVQERLNAVPNTKAYNHLTVTISYLTEIKKVMDVKRHLFTPRPNVDSAVVQLIKKETRELAPDQEARFFELVRAAFKQKRKTLINNWHEAFQIDKETLKAYLLSYHLSEHVRAEQLPLEKYIELTKGWVYGL